MGWAIKKTEAESKILRNVKEEIYVADDILKSHEAGNTGRDTWSGRIGVGLTLISDVPRSSQISSKPDS